jgi:hypothetical protein
LKGKIFLLSLFLLISLLILSAGNAAWQDPLLLSGRITATWEEEIVPEELLLIDELDLAVPVGELPDGIDPEVPSEEQDGADELDLTAEPSGDDCMDDDAGDDNHVPKDDGKKKSEQNPGETKGDHEPPTDESGTKTQPAADELDPADDIDGGTGNEQDAPTDDEKEESDQEPVQDTGDGAEDEKDIPDKDISGDEEGEEGEPAPVGDTGGDAEAGEDGRAEDEKEEGDREPEGDNDGDTEDEEKDVPANEEKEESEPEADKEVPAPVDAALPDSNGSSNGDDESSIGSNEDAHDQQ